MHHPNEECIYQPKADFLVSETHKCNYDSNADGKAGFAGRRAVRIRIYWYTGTGTGFGGFIVGDIDLGLFFWLFDIPHDSAWIIMALKA